MRIGLSPSPAVNWLFPRLKVSLPSSEFAAPAMQLLFTISSRGIRKRPACPRFFVQVGLSVPSARREPTPIPCAFILRLAEKLHRPKHDNEKPRLGESGALAELWLALILERGLPL